MESKACEALQSASELEELVKNIPPQADLHQFVINCKNCDYKSILLSRRWMRSCYCPSCGSLV